MTMNNETKNMPDAFTINRLFIAEYEQAKYWTGGKRNILTSIKDGDFYLIFKTGKNFIPSPMYQQIIEDMDTYKEVYDVEALGDEDYLRFIKSKVDRFSNENTNVYFLYMESIFDVMKEQFPNVANVQSCKNFRVGRIATKKKTVMKTDSQKPKSDNSDLFSGMNEVITIDDVNVHTTNQTISSEEMNNIEPPKREKSVGTNENRNTNVNNRENKEKEKKEERVPEKPQEKKTEKKEEKQEKEEKKQTPNGNSGQPQKKNTPPTKEEVKKPQEKETAKETTKQTNENSSFISAEDLLGEESYEEEKKDIRLNIKKEEEKEEKREEKQEAKKPNVEQPILNTKKDYENIGVNTRKEPPNTPHPTQPSPPPRREPPKNKPNEEREKKDGGRKIESTIDFSAFGDVILGEDIKGNKEQTAENIRKMEQRGREQKEKPMGEPRQTNVSGVQGSAPQPRQPRQQRPQRGGPQPVQKRPMGSSSSGDTLTIQELERQIFGEKQVTVSYDKEYKEVDDQKARMTNSIMERLIANINKFAKKVLEYDFNRAKYVELISMLIKSIDYNDFLDGWDIVEPGYPLLIDEKTYAALRDEALYYSKICEMLYEEDNW